MSADLTTAGTAPRIAVFVEGCDWHALDLTRALNQRGARVATMALSACAFDTQKHSGLDIPGFEGELPDGAFVCSLAAGSPEARLFELSVLHALKAQGVFVWNNPLAIETAANKAMTTFLLAKAGLAVLPTLTVTSRARARAYAAQAPRPTALKPLVTAPGTGHVQLAPGDAAPAQPEGVGGVYHLQTISSTQAGGGTTRAKPTSGSWHSLVSSGRVVASLERRWVPPRASTQPSTQQRPMLIACEPEPELARLAIAACLAVCADCAGVDIMSDETGQLYVLKLDGVPAWRHLQGVSDVDIAGVLARDFLAEIESRALPVVDNVA